MTAPLAVAEAGEQVSPLPAPTMQERPCLFADRVGAWYISSRSSQYRKTHGLYLTPVPVADFMAALIEARSTTVRLLDPAAGAGVLCCAVVERLVSRQSPPASIELVAYESDRDLCGPLASWREATRQQTAMLRRTTGAKPEAEKVPRARPTATESLPNKAAIGLDGPPGKPQDCSHSRDSTTSGIHLNHALDLPHEIGPPHRLQKAAFCSRREDTTKSKGPWWKSSRHVSFPAHACST